jgi:hypothetical protein
MQKRGNHRRTRSTLPEDLSKILSTQSESNANDRLAMIGNTGSVLVSSSAFMMAGPSHTNINNTSNNLNN